MPLRPAEQRLGTISVLTAAVLFGTTGTVLAHAPAGATALGVGAARLAIGGPTLLIAARLYGARVADLRPHVVTMVAGGVGAATFQLLYFVAATRTGVALGTVVTIGSGPVFSGAIHALSTRHRPATAWVLGTTLGITGVGLLALTGDRATVDAIGIAAAVGAGLGWASFTTMSKAQIRRGLDSALSLGGTFTTAAVLTAPLLFVEPMRWISEGRGLVIAAYLGIATLAVAYLLYGRALSRLPAPTVITLTMAEPVTAALLAAAVLHERVSSAGWLGIGLVVAGLAVTASASPARVVVPRTVTS